MSTHTLRRASHALWWILLAAAIIGSLTPNSTGAVSQFRDDHDRFLHIACYATLAIFRAFDSRRRQLLILLSLALLGIAIEFLQPSFGRAFDPADIFDNAIGLTIGFLIAAVVRKQFETD